MHHSKDRRFGRLAFMSLPLLAVAGISALHIQAAARQMGVDYAEALTQVQVNPITAPAEFAAAKRGPGRPKKVQ